MQSQLEERHGRAQSRTDLGLYRKKTHKALNLNGSKLYRRPREQNFNFGIQTTKFKSLERSGFAYPTTTTLIPA